MFFGMTLCFVPHLISLLITKKIVRHNHENNEIDPEIETQARLKPLVFLPAAVFDLISTCIQYFALNLTNASSFQMLSGIYT